jgi:hypothetical protein
MRWVFRENRLHFLLERLNFVTVSVIMFCNLVSDALLILSLLLATDLMLVFDD